MWLYRGAKMWTRGMDPHDSWFLDLTLSNHCPIIWTINAHRLQNRNHRSPSAGHYSFAKYQSKAEMLMDPHDISAGSSPNHCPICAHRLKHRNHGHGFAVAQTPTYRCFWMHLTFMQDHLQTTKWSSASFVPTVGTTEFTSPSVHNFGAEQKYWSRGTDPHGSTWFIGTAILKPLSNHHCPHTKTQKSCV